MQRHHACAVIVLLCWCLITNRCSAARVFNTSQGYRAAQFFGTDLRDPSRFGGLQWVHGFTANDYVDIVTFGEMLPTAVNLSIILRNFSYCWHYRVDDAIPAGELTLYHIVLHRVHHPR